MNKTKLWSLLVHEIERELEVMKDSLASTTDGVTHSEAKQEGKYDTRGLEASYLAGGQQRRVVDLENTLTYFKTLKEAMVSPFETAAFGALIEVEIDNKKHFYFMSRLGGGIRVTMDDIEVQVITHESPIGSEVIGLEENDSFEILGPKGQEELLLLKVY